MAPISLFLFHRDFRTVDNTSLRRLAETSQHPIVPIFVFTPDQVDPANNPYYNEKSIQFMIESLQGIPHLHLFYGNIEDVLDSLFRKNTVTHLGFNLDYTPYAKRRTTIVNKVCRLHGVTVVSEEDYTLVNMASVREGSFYKVFKPYYERVKSMPISVAEKQVRLSKVSLGVNSKYRLSPLPYRTTARKEGLSILANKADFSTYAKTRNEPYLDTTHLSKYIKYGTVSIREVYLTFRRNIDLARQVIWHDFYAQLMNYLPVHDTLGGGNFQHKELTWRTSSRDFQAWCDGRTGIPLVDAGMRQLNETGWMHNRIRLIVSNFLSLVLKIDWKKGEKYFAKKLVDYDVSSNNLNWQFSAQVGTDRQPYTRIYNPFIQNQKYDKECRYVKKWIPELVNVPCKAILRWYKYWEDYKEVGYPDPIVRLWG